MLSESQSILNTGDHLPHCQIIHKLAPRSTINICDAASPDRLRVEKFIKDGFAHAYNAQVSEFLPHLIYVENTRIRAALGIRSARSTLFLEQYLDLPVEHYVSSSAIVARSRIAEIGNLCSSNRRYTLPLFIAAAAVMERDNYTHAVFSATQKVASIIEAAGVKLCRIAAATGARLGDRQQEWGSYYETAPTIVSLSLADVAKAINRADICPPQVNNSYPLFPHLAAGMRDARCI